MLALCLLLPPSKLEMHFIVGEVNFSQGWTFKGERLPLLINKLVLYRQDTDIDVVFDFRLKFFLRTDSRMGFHNYSGSCVFHRIHISSKMLGFNVSTNYKLCIITFL